MPAARAMGLPAETLISEYAAGQLEVVLRHRADAMQAADEAIQWKRLVRAVAAKHGLLATFMAKPYVDRAGSGFHIHASLADKAGSNLFAAEDPEGTPLLRQAIAGLLATIGEGMGVFAPNANSYRRFQSASYAPIARTWGVNNRSVALAHADRRARDAPSRASRRRRRCQSLSRHRRGAGGHA